MSSEALASPTPRRWERFSLAERIGGSGFYLLAVIAIIWSFKTIEIIPEII